MAALKKELQIVLEKRKRKFDQRTVKVKLDFHYYFSVHKKSECKKVVDN